MNVNQLIEALQSLNQSAANVGLNIDEWDVVLKIDGVESLPDFMIGLKGAHSKKIILRAYVNTTPKVGFDSANP